MFRKIFALICTVAVGASLLSISAFANELIEKDGKTYYMSDNGKYITGWQTIDDNLYFFKKSGEAVTKSCVIGGIRYIFNSDGICNGKYTGWTKSAGKRYYYIDGVKQKGWLKSGEGWHYFDEADGTHYTGSVEIYGKTYTFSSSGVWDGRADYDNTKIYNTLNKKLSKDDYGGIYFDKNVVIVLSKNGENVTKYTNELKKEYAPIVVKECKFSVNELEEVRTYILKNQKKFNISSSMTDVKNNRIEVVIKKDNSDFSNYLNSLDDSDIIYVSYGDVSIVDD